MASGALVDRPSFAHRAGDRLRRDHRRRHGLGEGVRTVSAEALQPQRHIASHADGASAIHAGRPARTRHQDRVAARVDRAGVVSQYRRSDRHFAEPDIGRSGWTGRRGGGGIGAAAGAIPDPHHHTGPRGAERAAAALPGQADRPFAASDQGPGVVIGSASERRTARRIIATTATTSGTGRAARDGGRESGRCGVRRRGRCPAGGWRAGPN